MRTVRIGKSAFIPISSTRDSGMVPLATNAVRLAPKYEVPESKVMSPGIVIYRGDQSDVIYSKVSARTSRPLKAEIVEVVLNTINYQLHAPDSTRNRLTLTNQT